MMLLSLILAALGAATSTAQFTPAGFESNSHSCELCNLTFADANGVRSLYLLSIGLYNADDILDRHLQLRPRRRPRFSRWPARK